MRICRLRLRPARQSLLVHVRGNGFDVRIRFFIIIAWFVGHLMDIGRYDVVEMIL